MGSTFPPIPLLAPETPMLETLIMQMLRRRPTQRPTAREVKDWLARLVATLPPEYLGEREQIVEQDQ